MLASLCYHCREAITPVMLRDKKFYLRVLSNAAPGWQPVWCGCSGNSVHAAPVKNPVTAGMIGYANRHADGHLYTHGHLHTRPTHRRTRQPRRRPYTATRHPSTTTCTTNTAPLTHPNTDAHPHLTNTGTLPTPTPTRAAPHRYQRIPHDRPLGARRRIRRTL